MSDIFVYIVKVEQICAFKTDLIN